jgi:quaternary ammonium compound-resistance protein SugE
MLFLDESTAAVKIVSVSLIVAGVIGLNLSGTGH